MESLYQCDLAYVGQQMGSLCGCPPVSFDRSKKATERTSLATTPLTRTGGGHPHTDGFSLGARPPPFFMAFPGTLLCCYWVNPAD